GLLRPISVGCLITGKCNLHCDFCYGNREALPREEIAPAEWGRLFGRFREAGVMRVDISGGEPAMRRDVGDILGRAHAAGLNVVLSTNGLLWEDGRMREIPDGTRVHVSLDSGWQDIHNRSRKRRSLAINDG